MLDNWRASYADYETRTWTPLLDAITVILCLESVDVACHLTTFVVRRLSRRLVLLLLCQVRLVVMAALMRRPT